MRLAANQYAIKNTSIVFFIILYSFPSLCAIQEEKYMFKKEFISSISLIHPPPAEVGLIFHPLKKLFDHERMNLCKFAQKLTKFDSMKEEAFTRLFFPYTYHITYPDGSVMMDVAIWCWTVPKFYLRFGNSITDIRILLRKNEFSSFLYRFHVEIITSTPSSWVWESISEKRQSSKARNLSRLLSSLIVPPSVRKYLKSRSHKSKNDESITWKELLRHDRISWLLNYERLYICFTAKRYVKNVIPVLEKSSTGLPKIYKFFYPDRRNELHIAFKCPSTPIMYASFGETDYDIHIMLLQNSTSIFGVGSPIYSE